MLPPPAEGTKRVGHASCRSSTTGAGSGLPVETVVTVGLLISVTAWPPTEAPPG